MQAIFADTILKAELGPDEKDERVYDLNPLRSRQFQFFYGPEAGIAEVAVKKLRLTVYGKKEHIVLDADPTYNKHAVFDLLDKVAKGIPLTQMAVTQVGIKVTFAHNPTSRKPGKRAFDIGWPNSCSLKHDGRDLIIRKPLHLANKCAIFWLESVKADFFADCGTVGVLIDIVNLRALKN